MEDRKGGNKGGKEDIEREMGRIKEGDECWSSRNDIDKEKKEEGKNERKRESKGKIEREMGA